MLARGKFELSPVMAERQPNSDGLDQGQLQCGSSRQRPANPDPSESQQNRSMQGPRSPDPVEVKKELVQTSAGGTTSPLDELADATDSSGSANDAQANDSERDLEKAKAETGHIQTQRIHESVFNITMKAWRRETTAPFPTNLERLLLSGSFIRKYSPSTADRVKLLFEAYTGEPWLWWPFRPPKPPLGQGKVRLQWDDVSQSGN